MIQKFHWKVVSKRLLVAVATMLVLVCGLAWGETATISGRFMIDEDKPMSEGLVYIYDLAYGPPPSTERYWRVPDVSRRLDIEGRFSFQLEPGEYCFAAIKRKNGPTRFGPPLEGDQWVIAVEKEASPKRFRLAGGSKVDIGTIGGALPFKVPVLAKGMTAIEGIVQDVDGKPVEGVMAFAFLTPVIAGKPLFISDRTDRAGRFVLRVHEGGTYYLKLRDSIGGGIPKGGAIIDGDIDESMRQVTVKSGEFLQGLKFKVKTFPGRGKNKE